MHFQEDVLRDFFRVFLVLQVSERELVDLAPVRVDEVEKRLLLAILQPFEKVLSVGGHGVLGCR